MAECVCKKCPIFGKTCVADDRASVVVISEGMEMKGERPIGVMLIVLVLAICAAVELQHMDYQRAIIKQQQEAPRDFARRMEDFHKRTAEHFAADEKKERKE